MLFPLCMGDVRCVQAMGDNHRITGVEGMLAIDFGASRPRVLVVDDEVIIATLIAEMIAEDLQLEPVQAYSAEEAIEELERGEFTLVVSDIRMPGIGGFGLLEWIQMHRPELKERFLFVTGCAGGTAADEALARLGVPVIEKPFSCAILLERCRGLLTKPESLEVEVQGRCRLAA